MFRIGVFKLARFHVFFDAITFFYNNKISSVNQLCSKCKTTYRVLLQRWPGSIHLLRRRHRSLPLQMKGNVTFLSCWQRLNLHHHEIPSETESLGSGCRAWQTDMAWNMASRSPLSSGTNRTSVILVSDSASESLSFPGRSSTGWNHQNVSKWNNVTSSYHVSFKILVPGSSSWQSSMRYRHSCWKAVGSLEMACNDMWGYSREKPWPEDSLTQETRLWDPKGKHQHVKGYGTAYRLHRAIIYPVQPLLAEVP